MTGSTSGNAAPEGPAAFARRARAQGRGHGDNAALLALADAAAAEVSGHPPRGASHGAESLPAGLAAAQREWLRSAGPNGRAGYVPALVRAYAAGPSEAEHLSSEPVVDAVVSALMARFKPTPQPRGVVVYDPVCGTAGMLLAAASGLREAGAQVRVLGQEINSEASNLAGSALTVSGMQGEVAPGNCLTHDAWPDLYYDFAVAEPAFGLEWGRNADEVTAAHKAGRYPGGLPQRSDSTLLFVQHLVAKMRPAEDGGARAVVIVTPSVLRSSGGDSIRRWLLSEDLLEAVIALPEGISAGTGLRINALVLTNRRPPARQGRVQIIDLRGAYEDRGVGRVSRRRLRDDALASLSHALSTVKPGPVSRTVTADRFFERTVIVESEASDSSTPRQWRLRLSRADNADDFVAKRVQRPPSRALQSEEDEVCRIDADAILDRGAGSAESWARQRGWPVSRLSALVDAVTYTSSASSSDRPVALSQLGSGDRVMLPLEASHPALYGNPALDAPDRRFISFTTDGLLSADFLVRYLNSHQGVEARRLALAPLGGAASPRTVPRVAVEALLAGTVVPVPDQATQDELTEADAAVRAAAAHAARTADELWRTPEKRRELVRQIAPVNRAQSLAEWAQELPYPLATALWACEAQRSNPHAAHRQLFLFWEATAAFTGTLLLSALDQDESLRKAEMDSLRMTLATGRLSMQRATLGVWLVIVQRLGRRFRGMLDSDDLDERARVAALFAGAPDGLVRALCSTEMANLLGRVIKRRNDWSGHGGAMPEHVLREQNTWLTDQIEALRSLVDDAWTHAPLVRAGSMAYEEGVFVHDVELVMGLNTPFLTSSVSLGTPMERGQLYLVTDGAQRGLRIEPFVQLRASPSSAQFACYFYNRLDGEEARLVSYHLGTDGELSERSLGLATLVGGFAAPH